jgi:DNA modification methylase
MSLRDYLFYEEPGITLYCGDCREVLPLLVAQQCTTQCLEECTGRCFGIADLVVTDPPYGMGRFPTDGKDYLDSIGPALRYTFAALKDGGSMFVFTSTGEVLRVGRAVAQPLKRMLWMYKPADMTYPFAGWLLKSEAILWFAKGDRLNLCDRTPFRHDTYICTQTGREGVDGHPTVKPLSVISDLVSRCPVGGTVLDPFLGSGTTFRAAKDHGRKAIGIEIEPEYCEIAVKRLRQGVLAL